MVAAKSYEAVVLQIWSLLPSFCDRPTDVKTVNLEILYLFFPANVCMYVILFHLDVCVLFKVLYKKYDLKKKNTNQFAKNNNLFV